SVRRARTPVATSIFSSDDARLYIDFFLLGMPVATSIVILRGCPSLRRFCPGRPSLHRLSFCGDARRYVGFAQDARRYSDFFLPTTPVATSIVNTGGRHSPI